MASNTSTMITLNVRSVQSDFKWTQLASFMERHFPDVILLQETNVSKSPLPLLLKQFSFHFNPPVGWCSGTMIGLRDSSALEFQAHNIVVPGHLQEVVVTMPVTNHVFHIFNLYLPHSPQSALDILTTLRGHLADIQWVAGADRRFVIGGDFNVTLDPTVDRSGGVERHPHVAAALRRLCVDMNLADLWRDFHPTTPGFTYVGNPPLHPSSRLDRFYASPAIASAAHSVQVLASFSDHLAVLAHLKTGAERRRPPYWRFDNALLDDAGFDVCMRQLLRAFEGRRQQYVDVLAWWDCLKQEISTTCVRYARMRRERDDEVFRRLEHKVEQITGNVLLDAERLADLASAQAQVRDAYSRRSEKTLARTHHEHLMAVDSPAASLLARDAAERFRPLSQLRGDGGDVVSDGPSLCTIARRHFSTVFASDHIDVDESSDLFAEMPELSTVDRTYLDYPLSRGDFATALRALNKGKSPGIDGLTPEFYLHFWDVLAAMYTEVFTFALESGRLPVSVTKSVLTLLPKSGDKLEISNWRPISLLTTDYKVMARALATRLSGVIGSLVATDQGYCIPGRTIFDSLHLHRDVLDYANREQVPLAVLSLDQQGAFDGVSHEYLFLVLEKFGFGEYFLATLRTLYANARCFVRIGSRLTAPFPFGRGIRQGDPLSGLIYSLAIEPFLSLCRRHLLGFPLPGEQERRLMVAAYADDLSFFVSDDSDFEVVRTLYDTYAAQSGSRLNTVKSTGLWAGSWTGRSDRPLGFVWSATGSKFLGITLGNTPAVVATGFDSLHERFTAALRRWRHRGSAMSLRGRVLVANQFIAPRLWYTFQVLPPPPELLNRLQGELANFVWADRRHWTRMHDLCAPVHLGGLGLVHIPSKVNLFRIIFANRFIANLEDPPCNVMTRYFLRKYRSLGMGWQTFFLPHITKRASLATSPFLATVLQAWHAVKAVPSSYATTVLGLRDVPLSLSSLIPSASTPFIPSWSALGCRTIGDLLDGHDWRRLEDLPGFDGLSARVARALSINFKQVKAYCQLRFRGVRETVGPEPWPPPFRFRKVRDPHDKLTPLDTVHDRRAILLELATVALRMPLTLSGHWSDDVIAWRVLFRPPSLGLDAEVTWRLNKNRLADPIFLHHAGLSASPLCPWCHVRGTAWHMIFTCGQARPMWLLVHNLLKHLLSRTSLLLREIYVGFLPSNTTTVRQTILANFVVVLAKSTVYRVLVNYFKDGRPLSPYSTVLAARIRCRLSKEFAWHLGRGSMDVFAERWCVRDSLCSIRNGELAFADALIM